MQFLNTARGITLLKIFFVESNPFFEFSAAADILFIIVSTNVTHITVKLLIFFFQSFKTLFNVIRAEDS